MWLANELFTHSVSCSGAEVLGGHQEGVESGSPTAQSRLWVGHGQQQGAWRKSPTLLPQVQL